jgi:hypothetical protein
MFGPHSFFSILPFKIKLVWELGFLLEPKSKISLVIILQDYLRLENSPEFGLVFYIIKLGLSLYIYIYILNPIDSITQVLNFFYLFENPSVTLTFYFLHTEKFVPTQCDAPTTNIGLLKSVFLVIFFLKNFSLQYLIHYD